MNRIPVVSSNLAAVGFDPDSLTLEVEFLDGRVYQYFDVPAVEHEQLLAAGSVGGYFNHNIRNCYRYVQL